jgi:hypothetical protein
MPQLPQTACQRPDGISASKDSRSGFAPTRRHISCHAASWPWPGPTNAWATSCSSVSRIASSEFRSTKKADNSMVRWP